MELKTGLIEDYGRMPEEVNNLFRVLEIKMYAKRQGSLMLKLKMCTRMRIGKLFCTCPPC